MPTLNEANEGRKYVKRPNGGAAPCVNNQGRYPLSSVTEVPQSFFDDMRRNVGSEPRNDADIPCRRTDRGGTY